MSFSASSTKDTVLRAAQLATVLVREVRNGNQLFVGRDSMHTTRLLIPDLEVATPPQWSWLVSRPHPWRKQLWVKGRKLLASTVWIEAIANNLDESEAADNWDLPLEAIKEIYEYCDANRKLIQAEADEERQRMTTAGQAKTASPA